MRGGGKPGLAQLCVRSYDEPIGPNLLRHLRKERRMSQAEVARSVGLSRQSVNAIENGKCQPRLVVAYRLARLFGHSIESVFQLEELDRLEARETRRMEVLS
jgi:putative transcriptional regulator